MKKTMTTKKQEKKVTLRAHAETELTQNDEVRNK